LEKLPSAASRADTIAHRTARTIHEKMQEDPAFYKHFSELLEETIRAFREERIKANEYLNKVTKIMHSVLNRTGDDIPSKLENYDVAKAYFGSLKTVLSQFSRKSKELDDVLADAALGIDDIIERNRVVNWVNDRDVQNYMQNEIEDFLIDLMSAADIEITFDEIDKIMEQCLGIARARRP